MKNITLAIDEKLLEEVRIYAARQQTSVNALVRAHLETLVRGQERAQSAIADLKRLSESSEARLGPDFRFDREDSHAR
ncbi:MAG: DUF6364 family protein [Salinarimonas sp.]|jgi:plasmid stability protein|uniref:Uncharacterized protein n=1 Tax=Saliniramus fredricksonii TaxID=1653334 RepID=A0A0P7X4Y5_9HYPH|nr:DUF6364 family protein [Saliniramus fredricksonii]KPQ09959.1 MAG: hypothetical protein HLUCCO17_12700 [Saliniramus fredricksonii]MCC5978507.1 hypothetical protein [Salinarimonas sp.]SCC80850.1 hypothetical protein GA0071312_1778 [Saliniramus fredricksonii]